MSAMVTELLTAGDMLSNVMVMVSVPSVVRSAAMLNVAVAKLELTVKLPVNEAPLMSAVLMPVMVYGTNVPLATLVVVKVNVTDPPSFTLAADLDKEYVGVRLVSVTVTDSDTVGDMLSKATVIVSVPSVR